MKCETGFNTGSVIGIGHYLIPNWIISKISYRCITRHNVSEVPNAYRVEFLKIPPYTLGIGTNYKKTLSVLLPLMYKFTIDA